MTDPGLFVFWKSEATCRLHKQYHSQRKFSLDESESVTTLESDAPFRNRFLQNSFRFCLTTLSLQSHIEEKLCRITLDHQ